MNKIFCVDCGHKNQYELTKPKFCGACGKSVTGTVTSSANNLNQKAADLEEEEEGGSTLPDIEAMRGSVQVELEQGAKMTLANLWETAPETETPLNRSIPNIPDGKDILNQTMSDCAPSRESKNVGE